MNDNQPVAPGLPKGAKQLDDETPVELKLYRGGFSLGICVGMMMECCRRGLDDYHDLVPPAYLPQMRAFAAKEGYNVLEIETDEDGKILVGIEKREQGGDCVVRPSPVSLSGKVEI